MDSEQRLEIGEHVFREANDAFLVFRPEDSRLVEVNPSALRTTGFRRKEMIGRHLAEVLESERGARSVNDLIRAFEKTSIYEAREGYSLIRADGGRIPVSVNTSRIHTRPEPLGLLIARDVSERRRGEEERALLEAQLRREERLESLGLLAGGISHDFNNLLTGMRTFGDLALAKTEEGTQMHDYLRRIRAAVLRATDLTRQMLAFSGKASVETEPVDLHYVAQEVCEFIEPSLAPNVRLRLEVPRGLPCIEGDATQLHQVLSNLIANARDAIGERDGTIVVEASVIESSSLESEGAIPAELARTRGRLSPGSWLCLCVNDDGRGMEPRARDHAFEPFFTTKAGGRGLGTSIVLGVVRAHRGIVDLTSEPGKGTSVRVFLPALDEEGRPTVSIPDGLPAVSGSGRILVVDDEEPVRVAVAAILREVGYEVVTASCGRDGLERALAEGSALDAILLDVAMPDMDGSEVLRQLRASGVSTPVVLTSGYSARFDAADLVRTGVATFLPKPFGSAELLSVLQRAIART
mgnify:CR=1 FL=1